MKKLFGKSSYLLVVLCALLTSCRDEDKIEFLFKLACSEDFLTFVSPTATFVDEMGNECVIKLTSDMFIDETDNNGLVGDGHEHAKILCWKKNIIVKARSAQRDMRITYEPKSDLPQIDMEKQYSMAHSLKGGHCFTSSWGASVVQAPVVVISSNITLVQGSELEKYLTDLQETYDYVIETAKY